MKSGSRSILLQVLVGAGLSCAGAHAATLTYYIDVFSGTLVAGTSPITANPPSVPVQVAAGGSPTTIGVPQFNTGLGTLTQVDFTLLTYSTADATVTNKNTGSSENYTNLSTSMPITVSQITAPNVSLSATNTAGVPSGTVGAAGTTSIPIGIITTGTCTALGGTVSSGNCILPIPTTQDNPGLTATNSDGTSINSGLSAFEGASPINVMFQALVGAITVTGTETTGNGDLSFGGSGTAGAIFEVTYEYNAVLTPEPTSMVLIGSSILGLGLLLRRKGRK